MGMPDPATCLEWRGAGRERADDADALVAARREVGGTYLYGFAVECYAKGLIAGRHQDQLPPKYRHHRLMELIYAAGLRRDNLPEPLRDFAETHDVALRYQAGWPPGLDTETMESARRLAGLLLKQIDRTARNARARARRPSSSQAR